MKPFSTLRGRLVGWSLLVNALILGAFGGGLWFTLHQVQDQQLSTTLQISVAQLAAAADVTAGRANVPASDAAAATGRGLFAWIVDQGGRVQATIGPVPGPPPQPLAPAGELLDLRLASGIPIRLYRQDLVPEAGAVPNGLALVVGISRAPQEATDATVLLILAGAIPLALALAAAGAYFLAGRALTPISSLTAQARQIRRDNLDARLVVLRPPAEVAALAQTFNEVLDRLEAAFAHEQQFTADAAHELRTPLGLLKTQISLALSRPRSAPALTDMLRDMDADVDRLGRLIDAMLTLARLGTMPICRSPVDLVELLEELVDQLRPLAAARGTALTLDAPVSAILVGDADQLIQLFLNLLDNAVRYSAGTGPVRVSLAAAEDEWKIAIQDSGPGIAEDQLPHLFDRFYRVDPARARQTGGVGLGLSIAQAIAVRHEGRITVQSRVPEGSTFIVYLPC
ncbi:MAG: sensor histidine kinase [Chloroflexia bacterium]